MGSEGDAKPMQLTSAAVHNVPATESQPPLAHAPLPLPKACVGGIQFDASRESACYFASVEQHREMTARDVREPHCWGRGGNGSDALLLHTVTLTRLPNATALLLDSFLATQCCDSVLWLWVTRGAYDTVAGVLLDADARGWRGSRRVVLRLLDIDAEFASIREDFSDVSDADAAAMQNFSDVRFRANWARILILYKYGGIYVDLDTVFLRDYRPLFALPGAFSYRAGNLHIINIAVLRLMQRPEERTRRLIGEAARRHKAAQSDLTDIIRPGVITMEYPIISENVTTPRSRRGQSTPVRHLVKRRGPPRIIPQYITYAGLALFDAVWFAFLGATFGGNVSNIQSQLTHEMAAAIAAHGPTFTLRRHWRAFFDPLPAPPPPEQMFFPGSFSYHWHNRYELGMPNGSWAAVLGRRFEAEAREKVRFCERLQ